MNWYEEIIEEKIRPLVRLLRDNGFNTECSCGHKGYVQCQLMLDGELQRLHNLLYNNGYRNYNIDISINVIDGHLYTTLNTELGERRQSNGTT